MTHFAVLCPETPGHLNPMTSLLSELRSRGHRVSWLCTLDGAELVRSRQFEPLVIGRDSYPIGTMERTLAELGRLSGVAAVRFTLQQYRRGMRVVLDEAPAAIEQLDADALVADESVFAAKTVADLVQLPWFSVCNALPMLPDADHPPLFPAWRYRPTAWGRCRNRLGRWPARVMLRGIARLIVSARRRHNLPACDLVRENDSQLATLAQLPSAFDYPRRTPLPWFHYVGALHDLTSRPPLEFPYELLNDRPLIYASLGTVQNRLLPIFRRIAAACEGLPVQLVISLGGGARVQDLGTLPGDPLVVRIAPQLELIRRARLVITHAGMNTTLESLAEGVPLVAIPITNDQPAIARRIEWTGCGVRIPLRSATEARIRDGVEQLLFDERYTVRARELAAANSRSGGRVAAADLITQLV